MVKLTKEQLEVISSVRDDVLLAKELLLAARTTIHNMSVPVRHANRLTSLCMSLHTAKLRTSEAADFMITVSFNPPKEQ